MQQSDSQGPNLPQLPPDVLDHVISAFVSRNTMLGLRLVCQELRDKVLLPLVLMDKRTLAHARKLLQRTKEIRLAMPFDEIDDLDDLLNNNSRVCKLSWRFHSEDFGSFQRLLFALGHNKSIRELEFMNSLHASSRGNEIAGILTSSAECRITSLTVSGCGLRVVGAAAVFQAASINKSLTHLNVSANQMSDNIGEELYRLLVTNKSITSLDLSRNSLGNTAIYFIGKGMIQNQTIQTLDISFSHHLDAALTMFSEMFSRNATLRTLNMELVRLPTTAAIAMREQIQSNTTLRSLDIGGITSLEPHLPQLLRSPAPLWKLVISSIPATLETMRSLGEAICQKPTLSAFEASHCELFDPKFEALVNGIVSAKHLLHLKLEYNKIGASRNLGPLTKLIAEHPSLISLDLQGNKIFGDDLEPFSEALAYNTTLRRLNLANNPIGAGSAWLAFALEDNVALQELLLTEVDAEEYGTERKASAISFLNAIEASAEWRSSGINVAL